MKKVFFITLVALFSLSACVPDFLNSDAQDTPPEAIDIPATVEAAASTKAVQTFEALPTPTMEDPTAEPPTDEPTATLTATATPSQTPTIEVSETPDGTETLTEMPDGTPSTETSTETPDGTAETATQTPDGTLPAETATLDITATSVFSSPTSPIYANEAPDYIPRFKIKVRNNTKVRVYISLQGTTVGGYKPIIEYDLAPWEKTKITVPEGYYAVIVYVGKEPMIGYIGIHHNNTVEITINKTDLKITK
ncbi:MAG: hypothetical protein GY755_19325 [Chloroflexi bacterium]|nr:hypothetical protein [Chloroflexota bacterium]